MPIRISNITLDLDHPDDAPVERAVKWLGVARSRVRRAVVHRRSVDARRGRPLRLIYQVDVDLDDDEAKCLERRRRGPFSARHISRDDLAPPEPGEEPLQGRVIVVGAGPCGLFAAYRLAQRGYRPLLIERGKPTESRMKDLRQFRLFGNLTSHSNLLFGEGGAGMYSDGKLTTRNRNPLIDEVLGIFHRAGAPDSILTEARPHIGSNLLPKILRRMRATMESMGVTYRFESDVVQFERDVHGRLAAVGVRDVGGLDVERHEVGAVVLAAGGSAREIFVALAEAGVYLEARPTLMGVRVEHPQALVDRNQYGERAAHPRLGSAEYFLTLRANEEMPRPVHSFCMCPGGEVIAIASEAGGVSANGMSNYSRRSGFANSAMIAPVDPADYGVTDPAADPLAGIEFQRQIERAVFEAGGRDYSLPAQRLDDFFHGRPSARLAPGPKVTRKRAAAVHELLPACIVDSVRRSLAQADHRIPGFLGADATVYGVEVRTSSPVRIVRADGGISVNTDGLYPAGEGAGYAGGIMSAALDGMEQADRIIARHRAPRD